jgi:serine/threonine-protein kinase RsbW
MEDESNSLSDSIGLSVPARVENLHLIRYVVQHAAENFGFTREDAAMIQMAVDEACTNVVLHGRRSTHGEQVQSPLYVRICFQQDRLVIQIVDGARRFSPLDWRSISVDEYVQQGHTHGLGIFIMKSFMDEIIHEYDENVGNRLRLIKVLPRAEQKPKAGARA